MRSNLVEAGLNGEHLSARVSSYDGIQRMPADI